MTVGMVVRDDNGGLGNLTYEAWRHLQPDVTLVVQSRPCRGTPRPHVFEEAWTTTIRTSNPVPDAVWSDAALTADVWWSAETWYSDRAERIMAEAGCRSILLAMPELFAGSQADEVWNPTAYLTDRDRLDDVMMWPASPPPTWKVRTRVRRILHVVSGAMGDRNGTELLLDAIPRMQERCEVLVHQPDPDAQLPARRLHAAATDRVEVRTTTDYVSSLDSLLKWADLLVLPRRYAGLCLPAYEAWGLGCLVMMPDVDPQASWPIVKVPARADRPMRMKGGRVPTWSVDPVVLANRLDEVVGADTPWVADRSRTGRGWVEWNSWERRGKLWKERLWA